MSPALAGVGTSDSANNPNTRRRLGMNYQEFIGNKGIVAPPVGLTDPPELAPVLREHQRLLTAWALRRGRAAVFASTGLGKTPVILEWCRVVSETQQSPVLILAPLAVSRQFVDEAEKLGLAPVKLAYSQEDVSGPGIFVTNYAKLHRFDMGQFAGVALDESSILKHLGGSTRTALIESCARIPFRLAATATPAPNDHIELGGQSEFLGVLRQTEMLSQFFIHDGGNTASWRLKGHARRDFWRWVCSWGAIVHLPSDIGCSDDGYILPELRYHEHTVPAGKHDILASGLLFANDARTLTEQRQARKASIASRVEVAAGIINGQEEQAIAWCDLNDESSALAAAIPESAEITGSMADDEKEFAIEVFCAGRRKALVSKPSICGFGLNLQFSRLAVFCGVSHSFEQFYQAIRRQWRFGVEAEVDAHIVISELEGEVLKSLKEKQRKAAELSEETRHHVAEFVRESVASGQRDIIGYNPRMRMKVPRWVRSGE